MNRFAVAAIIAMMPIGAMAQNSGHVPLPYNNATAPSLPYPPTSNFESPYIPSMAQAPTMARLVDADHKNGVIRDYLVLTDQPSDKSTFAGVLKQCSDQGNVSELLVDSVVESSRYPRAVKVINCSKTALDATSRMQQLQLAKSYYARNLALDRPADRRAVQAAFAVAIDKIQ